ncbi:Eukaryotic translation initiation factor 4G [Acorus calamus]|uniref:Eukaryotic translation initiation factor 4G n=1 Tax=Acorus calamus TaxID=4465 RepID=A0AAV9DZT2_ACOCL|nr:Eukaryotic translation initiation factor 4G [Acorus calamus]
MDAYFDQMHKLSTNQKLSSRVRFMLRDAIDLRKNKWQQRRKVEGPKKIEEVHRDAAQERHLQTSRLARGPSTGSSARRGPPGDYGPRYQLSRWVIHVLFYHSFVDLVVKMCGLRTSTFMRTGHFQFLCPKAHG